MKLENWIVAIVVVVIGDMLVLNKALAFISAASDFKVGFGVILLLALFILNVKIVKMAVKKIKNNINNEEKGEPKK